MIHELICLFEQYDAASYTTVHDTDTVHATDTVQVTGKDVQLILTIHPTGNLY
jgi:hypothetical protein